MADGEDMNPAIPQDHQLVPALQKAFEAFQTPEGQKFAATVLPIIQQHVNAVNVANANQQAGDRSVQNVADTKNALVNAVKDDPTAASMALHLAPHLVAGVVSHSGLTTEQMQSTHADLTSHMQSEIAKAAVTRMAEIGEGPARQLLDVVGEHLTDGEKGTLGQYIDTMQVARGMDHSASLAQMQYDNAAQSRRAAYGAGGQLLNARTEETQAPSDFVSSLMSANHVRAADRVPLMIAYNNLRSQGDPTTSDPHVINGLLQKIADPTTPVPSAEILQHVGSGLRYVDAHMLHGLSLVRTPEAQAHTQQIASMVDNAREELTPAASAAHNAAFGRYVNWLMPSIRAGANIDPMSKDYILNRKSPADFAPKHADIVPPYNGGERPPLASFFGGAA